MLVKVRGGFKIRSKKTGKLYPKKYKSKKAAQERENQMERWKNSDKWAYKYKE